MIRVSAPAKIHLLGEHSVSYGRPALLTAIDLRLTLSLDKAKTQSYPIKQIAKAQKATEKSIKMAFKIKKIPPYKIEIDSQIPIGSGLGSSSAISACLTKALLTFLKISSDNEKVYKLAMDPENIFHGKSSGGDLAAVTYGGLIWFRNELDNLKIIKPLDFLVGSKIGYFFLVDSGKPKETTRQMVEKVGILNQNNPFFAQKIFSSQESLTKQMAVALQIGDTKKISAAIKLGQRNLEKLGVVGKKSLDIIRKIEKSGGYAKILGGGGIKGGSGMILVYHKDPKKLKSLDLNPIPIKLAQEGLRVEK